MKFIMFVGVGNPNESIDYQHAVETLYTVSYGIKFAMKSEGYDHVVPPLEGLWWMDDMRDFTVENKYRWQWTMMIMQPDWVINDIYQNTMTELIKKKKISSQNGLRFQPFEEGLCVQILYTGTYTAEAEMIKEMHLYIKANAYILNGKHHEIYLGDPRKTAPEKLQTILRQPIRKQTFD